MHYGSKVLSFMEGQDNFNSSYFLENCYILSEEEDRTIRNFRYWVGGVIGLAVSAFGLCSNVISIYILSRKELQSFFSWLLIALSVFDSGFVTLYVFKVLHMPFDVKSNYYVILYPYLFHPFITIFKTSSVYMTIAIAYERYSAICRPMRAGLRRHSEHDLGVYNLGMEKRRLAKYSVAVLAFSLTYSLPRFFETDYVYNEYFDGYEYYLKPTEFRENKIYRYLYVGFLKNTLTGLIPLTMLTFYYVKIFCRLRQHNTEVAMALNNVDEMDIRQKHEMNMAYLFTQIILLFLLCHLPSWLINFHELTLGDKMELCNSMHVKGGSAISSLTSIFVTLSDLMLLINSSINIVFYTWHTQKFKYHLKKMCQSRCSNKEQNFPEREGP